MFSKTNLEQNVVSSIDGATALKLDENYEIKNNDEQNAVMDSFESEEENKITNNKEIKKNNTNFKGVGQPLRIALTGSKFGPGIYDIIISLGKEEVIKRLGNNILI